MDTGIAKHAAGRYPLPAADLASLGIRVEQIDRLRALIAGHIADGRYPGCQIALARHGQLGLFESFGNAVTTTRSYEPLSKRLSSIVASGPGGIYVFSPAGTLLGRIETGQASANCAWGNTGSTLYICADMYMCRIQTSTRGRLP